MKILCTGDLHMGRRPSKLADPDEAKQFSATAMWSAIVERAVAEQVDLLALTGDVVDRDNGYFEAIGPLERGLARLAEAGIATYAVSGNHDWDVFVRLADTFNDESFQLLGRGGRWQEVYWPAKGTPRLRLVGWSFPAESFSTDPLAELDLLADDRVPTLGLLHADLDQLTSRYAPVARAALVRQPVAAWLLGHVHRPAWTEHATGASILYPGSPQALDPGETGPHGPWLLELDGTGRVSARQIALSRVRYDTLDIDLEGVASRAEFESRVTTAVRGHAEEAHDGGPLALLSLRLQFVGRTPLNRELHTLAGELFEGFDLSHRGVSCRVERAINRTKPQINLEDLAKSHDAPGTVARLVRELESEMLTPDVRTLIDRTAQELMHVHRSAEYGVLGEDAEPTSETARRRLLQESYSLLDALLAQKESA